jgi:hypothetical protein
MKFEGVAEVMVLYIYIKISKLAIKHSWSNGRIIAFQAIGPGSTPGGCTTSFSSIATVVNYLFALFVVSVWRHLVTCAPPPLRRSCATPIISHFCSFHQIKPLLHAMSRNMHMLTSIKFLWRPKV